jgi:hypothetical protein
MERKGRERRSFKTLLMRECRIFSDLGINMPLKELKELPRCYNIKVVSEDGVACVSVTGWNCYSPYNSNEPKGKIFGPFKSKKYKRYRILKKLGLWENGRILPRERNQTSLDLL